ncbi:MAG: hypothetical protein JWQ98_3535 [Chlorobi bacterium]|nr:hypothetical protein [Chlorobiota bacterium]
MLLGARQIVSEGGSIDLTAPSLRVGPGNNSPGVRAKDGETGPNRGDNGKQGDNGGNGATGAMGGT